MCEPISISASTLAIASLAATVVGTSVAAYGAIQSGNAQKAAAAAREQQNRNNAVLAQRAADDALARGDINAGTKARQTAQLMGQQRAGLAANGIDTNEGSALDLQADVAASGEFDQLTIRSNAMREAAGYEAQGMNYQTQGSIDRATGDNAASAGMLSATSSIVGGAGAVASQWYDFKHGKRVAA